MSDLISFNCPNCSTLLDVPAELAGVTGPCPSCGITITAPAASTTQPTSDLAQSSTTTELSEVRSQNVEPKVPTKSVNIDAAQQAEFDDSSATQNTGSWRHGVKNALIGFISVFALAAATWGIAKAIENSKTTDQTDITSPPQRIAPAASPMGVESESQLEVGITEDGKIKEGNNIFPITNTTEPPTLNFASNSKTLVTPSNIIDQNRAELDNLLGDAPAPVAPRQVPQSDSEKMVVETRQLIRDFLAAESLEERLPLMFSERIAAAEMSESFAGTILDGPILLAETVSHSSVIYLGNEGPNAEGITQLYFYVTLAASDDESMPPRNIIIHMANHYEGKYRINADAFLFCADNKLEKFIKNPKAEPLIAYLFLERCHYKAGAEKAPSGTFSVRLLADPMEQSANTALVDTMRSSGELLNPVVKWGVPPRAAIVELKHEPNPTSGDNLITINRLLKLNWLQSYDATPGDD